MLNNNAQDRLIKYGIRPSVQRIAIMQYLLDHKTHPTAEEVFCALQPSMPTLSKTTVYNTLKLFVENKVALMIDIEEKNVRFDGDTSLHAHFICQLCGRIYDVFVSDMPELKMVDTKQIGDLQVTETEVYYKGYCNKCLNKQK